MKKCFLIIAVLILFSNPANAQNNSTKNADEASIRSKVEEMANGWNAKSGEQFARPFAEDADYVVINGMQIKTRKVIAKGHQEIFDTVYKNSNLTLGVDSIRFLKTDVALVHISGVLKITETGSARTRNVKITLVMTKNENKWEIAAFQNTQVVDEEKGTGDKKTSKIN